MEQLPTDQPQYTGEFAQCILTKVLTTYNVILRENFIYSSLSLFRETKFYLPPFPDPQKETKSQYKQSSYNHVCKMNRTKRWPVVMYGYKT